MAHSRCDTLDVSTLWHRLWRHYGILIEDLLRDKPTNHITCPYCPCSLYHLPQGRKKVAFWKLFSLGIATYNMNIMLLFSYLFKILLSQQADLITDLVVKQLNKTLLPSSSNVLIIIACIWYTVLSYHVLYTVL